MKNTFHTLSMSRAWSVSGGGRPPVANPRTK